MPDVVWRRTAEGVVLRRVSGEDYVVLNGTAAAVWEALDCPQTLDQAVRDLTERYATSPAVLQPDLVQTLQDLQERGLVDEAPA